MAEIKEKTGVDNNSSDVGKTNNSDQEPLIVGTNTTFKIDSSSSGASSSSDSSNSPLAVGTNLTIEITDPDEQLLKQLGINKDGSNNYLGTNISTDGDGSSWMERNDNNPLAGGEIELADSDGEPLLIGTNITFKISSDTQSSQDGAASTQASQSGSDSNAPIAVGTNLTLELTDSSGDINDLIEQLGITANGSNDYLGNNISTSGDGNSWGNKTNEDPLTGGGMPLAGGNGNAPQNGDLYKWDISAQADELTSGGSGDMGSSSLDKLFEQSPWGTLKDVGITSFKQVFPNASSDLENNPFAGGASGSDNPFAGGFGDGAVS